MAARNIELEWGGDVYVIPANEVFEVGAEVEEVVTLPDIANVGKKLQFRKIAKCYGILLRHAGASVTDQQVFSHMMDQFKSGAEKKLAAMKAIEVLTEILMDGAPDVDTDDADDDGKKKTAAS